MVIRRNTAFADVGSLERRIIGLQPIDVVIRQREYQHEVAVLTFGPEPNPYWRWERFGAPIVIRWGHLPGSAGRFIGYVHHKEVIEEEGKPLRIKVYCIGATLPFNQRSRRTLRYPSVQQAVRALAGKRKIDMLVDGTLPWKPVSTVQNGISDWDQMVKLAKSIGATLNPQETVVRLGQRVIDMKTPYQFRRFAEYRQRLAIYSYRRVDGGSKPQDESWVNRAVAVTPSGIKHFGRSVVDERDERPPVFSRYIDSVMRSRAEAMMKVNALDELGKFKVSAKAELSGHALVRPGKTVALETTDSFNGCWWVTGVDHHIVPGDYRMVVQIARESIPQPRRQPPRRSWRQKPALPRTPSIEPAPQPAPTVFEPDNGVVPVEELVREPLEPTRVKVTAGRRRERVADCCNPAPPVPRLTAWRASNVRGS